MNLSYVNSDAILNFELIAMHCGLSRIIFSFLTAVKCVKEKWLLGLQTTKSSQNYYRAKKAEKMIKSKHNK